MYWGLGCWEKEEGKGRILRYKAKIICSFQEAGEITATIL